MRQLLMFPHSHFCEKAAWALDYKGLSYEKKFLFPGLHLMQVRRIAAQSSVPVLLDEQQIVQGADAIISFLDKSYPDAPLNFFPPEREQEAGELERKMDLCLGEPLRQIAYARLLDYPDYCATCFVGHAAWWQRKAFQLIFPKLRKILHEAYVKSEASVENAVEVSLRAMDELDDRLANSDFLVGNQFTRVDLSVCAMLSLIVQPEEHPFDWPVQPSPELEELIAPLRERRFYQWAQGIYREYR